MEIIATEENETCKPREIKQLVIYDKQQGIVVGLKQSKEFCTTKQIWTKIIIILRIQTFHFLNCFCTTSFTE